MTADKTERRSYRGRLYVVEDKAGAIAGQGRARLIVTEKNRAQDEQGHAGGQ